MNVCLNPSNFGDNIYTRLPSAVDGSKEMMSSPQSRHFWLKEGKDKLVKPTHPLAAWSSDTQTHLIVLGGNTMVQTPAYPENYSSFFHLDRGMSMHSINTTQNTQK